MTAEHPPPEPGEPFPPPAAAPDGGQPAAPTPRRLRRRSPAQLGGVAGGLARYLDIDAKFFRVAFVILTLIGGSGGIIYLAAWLLIPGDDDDDPRPLALTSSTPSLVAGFLVLAAGALGLVQGESWGLGPGVIIPAIFVIVGLWILNQRGERDPGPELTFASRGRGNWPPGDSAPPRPPTVGRPPPDPTTRLPDLGPHPSPAAGTPAAPFPGDPSTSAEHPAPAEPPVHPANADRSRGAGPQGDLAHPGAPSSSDPGEHAAPGGPPGASGEHVSPAGMDGGPGDLAEHAAPAGMADGAGDPAGHGTPVGAAAAGSASSGRRDSGDPAADAGSASSGRRDSGDPAAGGADGASSGTTSQPGDPDRGVAGPAADPAGAIPATETPSGASAAVEIPLAASHPRTTSTADFSLGGPEPWDTPPSTAAAPWALARTETTTTSQPVRTGPPVTSITLAAIAIVVGVFLVLTNIAGLGISAAAVLGTVLAVIGAGLIASSVYERAIVLYPLALLVGAMLLIAPLIDTTLAGGVGTREIRVVTDDGLRPSYSLGMGELLLDLGDYSPTSDRTVEVDVGAGYAEITVPSDVRVEVVATNRFGYVEVDGLSDEGVINEIFHVVGPSDSRRSAGEERADGEEPPTLRIEADVTFGYVEVRRG